MAQSIDGGDASADQVVDHAAAPAQRVDAGDLLPGGVVNRGRTLTYRAKRRS
jgi:hypothetical protein